MKKTNPPLFGTGICDSTHSKRTIVSLINGIKSYIPASIHVVSGNQVSPDSFTDIVTEKGCIYLGGAAVCGLSLYDVYRDYRAASFKNSETEKFLRTVVALIDASIKYRDILGGFPIFLLNSVYVTEDHSKITYLPFALIDYLNTFYEDGIRQVLYYPAMITQTSVEKSEKYSIGRGKMEKLVDEHLFSRILARLLYLFFTKNRRLDGTVIEQSVYDSRVYYLKTEIEDIPKALADTLWDIMHGKKIQLALLRGTIASCATKKTEPERAEKIPLSRRRNVVSFRTGMAGFFTRRWKMLLVILILLGVALYLLSDIMSSRRREDYTAGLAPRQVVELYFTAINTLDLNVLDSIYYKRKGKKVKDELSTVFVMLRMESAFGKTLVFPDELTEGEFDPQLHTVFGIRDLELGLIQDDDVPVFRARYVRVVSSGESLHETVIEETIQLQYIDDHWYITESERSILSEGSRMRGDQ
jgi:hypothetical protein